MSGYCAATDVLRWQLWFGADCSGDPSKRDGGHRPVWSWQPSFGKFGTGKHRLAKGGLGSRGGTSRVWACGCLDRRGRHGVLSDHPWQHRRGRGSSVLFCFGLLRREAAAEAGDVGPWSAAVSLALERQLWRSGACDAGSCRCIQGCALAALAGCGMPPPAERWRAQARDGLAAGGRRVK